MFKVFKLGHKVPIGDLRIICKFRKLLDNEFIYQWDGSRIIISVWEGSNTTKVIVSPSNFTIFKDDKVTTLYINDFILRQFKSVLRKRENRMYDVIRNNTYALMDNSNTRSLYD